MLTVTPPWCPTTETAAMTGMKCHHWDKQSQRDKVLHAAHSSYYGKDCTLAMVWYCTVWIRHSSVSDIAPATNTMLYNLTLWHREGETPTKKHKNQTNRATKGPGPWLCRFFSFSFLNLLLTFFLSNLTLTNNRHTERNWKQCNNWEKWTQHEITETRIHQH